MSKVLVFALVPVVRTTSRVPGLCMYTGGLVDRRESVCDAAVRECREETGIETEFVALSAFRESQTGPFGTSDL